MDTKSDLAITISIILVELAYRTPKIDCYIWYECQGMFFSRGILSNGIAEKRDSVVIGCIISQLYTTLARNSFLSQINKCKFIQ